MSEPIASATVRINPDTTGFRDDLRAKLDAIFAGVRDKDIHARVEVDGAAQATAELQAVEEEEKRVGREARAAAGSEGIGGLMTAAMALGPALVPVVGAAAAGMLAFGSAVGAAGAGLGAFALVAKPALTAVQDAQKKLVALQHQYDAATTSRQRLDILAKERALWAELTPAEAAALHALQDFRAVYDKWAAALQAPVLRVFTDALHVAREVLPSLSPLVEATATAFHKLFGEMGASLSGPTWQGFFRSLGQEAGPALLTFGRAIGNVVTGMGGLLQAFAPLAAQIEPAIVRLTHDFAVWGTTVGQSSGFSSFIDYVRQTGPEVVATLGRLVAAFGHIVAAAAPLGPLTLGLVGGLADLVNWLSRTDPHLLTAGIAVLQLSAAFKVARVAMFALAENPVVAALALIGLAAYELYRHWDTVWKAIKQVTGDVIGWLITGIRHLLDVYLDIAGGLLHAGATVAEALHLPFAKGIRAASNELDAFHRRLDHTADSWAASAHSIGDKTGAAVASGISSRVPAAKAAAARLHMSVDNALRLGVGSAYDIGQMTAAGLARGIQSMMGAVTVQAKVMADSIAKRMRLDLQQNSPSKVTFAIGQGVGQGLALGMASTLGQVRQSAAALAAASLVGNATAAIGAVPAGTGVTAAALAAAAARATATQIQTTHAEYTAKTAAATAAQRHAVALASEAEKAELAAERLRRQADAAKAAATASSTHSRYLSEEGRLTGRVSTAAKIAAEEQARASAATAAALDKQARAAESASKKQQQAAKAAADAAKKAAADAAAAMQALADAVYQRQLDIATKTVDRLQSQLQTILDKANSFTQSFAQAVTQGTDLSTLFQGTDAKGQPTLNSVDSVISALQDRVTQAQRFQADTASLIQAGLSPDVIAQLQGAGATVGDQIAQSILSAGPEAVAKLNALNGQLQAVATAGAQQLAEQMYGPGANAILGLIGGMASKFPELADTFDQVVQMATSAFGQVSAQIQQLLGQVDAAGGSISGLLSGAVPPSGYAGLPHGGAGAGVDAATVAQGSAAVYARLAAVYAHRGVSADPATLDRLTSQVLSGQTSFDAVRSNVGGAAGTFRPLTVNGPLVHVAGNLDQVTLPQVTQAVQAGIQQWQSGVLADVNAGAGLG